MTDPNFISRVVTHQGITIHGKKGNPIAIIYMYILYCIFYTAYIHIVSVCGQILWISFLDWCMCT